MSVSHAAAVRPAGHGRAVFICLLVVVIGLGAAVLGTMSTFSTAITKHQNTSTGTFVFNLADPGSGAVFSTDISGMAPGDFGDRLVNLSNTGSINFSSVAIAVTAPTSSALDTDAVNGLQLQIAACSVAWTQASNTAAATCSGTTTVLTAAAAISALKSSGPSYTSSLACLTGGGPDYLRFHYSLPSASTGTAGLTSGLDFTFTATQASGGAYH